MKTNIVLALDTRRPRQDNTCAVLLRIVHYRLSSQISTGIYIPEKDWDAKERKVKSSYKGTESVTRLNNQLQKKKTEAMDIITKLDERKQLDSLSVLEIKELIEKKHQRYSVYEYIEVQIASMKEAHQYGNAGLYKAAIGLLKGFSKKDALTFPEINLQFLKRFETAHFAKGNSPVSLTTYMRTFRAIYNRAIKDGIVDKELYPFEHYEIKAPRTRKRAISLEAIHKIANLSFEPGYGLFHARNYFLLSFYMRGMSFADLAFLRVKNIIDGRIFYQRRKTDKPYNIKITAEIWSLMAQYIEGKEKEDFLFPIIHTVTPENQYKSMLWARNRYNKKLKRIAQLCEIEENLTSYVSRHSFATAAKNKEIPIAAISEMMGHSDIKTTEIYLASLPSDVLDQYHEKIIK